MRIFHKVIVILFILLDSCSPKLKSSIINQQESLSTNDNVIILGISDDFENDGIKVGEIKATDNGLSLDCSYYEVIEHLKNISRSNGANLVKITEHRPADFYSSCDRISAKIYRVPNVKKYEREIIWTPDRTLTWEDFKSKPRTDANNSIGAETNCGFGFLTSFITPFTKPKVFVHAKFYCFQSWVKEGQLNNADLLRHEQFHFNLSEVYARKLRKEISETIFKSKEINQKTQILFEKVYADYLNQQNLYDSETLHGLNIELQNKWESQINSELSKLTLFENVMVDRILIN